MARHPPPDIGDGRRLPGRGRRRRRRPREDRRPEHTARRTSHLVHVRPRARRQGVAKALLRELRRTREGRWRADDLARRHARQRPARTVWRRLGFEDVSALMARPHRRARAAASSTLRHGESSRIDARADRRRGLGRAGDRAVPAAARGAESCDSATAGSASPTRARPRSRGARPLRPGAVRAARRGHRRARAGGPVVRFRLYERGRMVDEYLSVPTFYGAAAEGRRARARGEPDARRAPDRRRPRRGPARRAHRRLARRAAAGRGAVRADRRA